ncbi:MAG: hypothetical protein MZV64_59215 [Ignavibacteriales bacterium]|nr:hypothetical protein [Ignavibacteriales bacterium]
MASLRLVSALVGLCCLSLRLDQSFAHVALDAARRVRAGERPHLFQRLVLGADDVRQ